MVQSAPQTGQENLKGISPSTFISALIVEFDIKTSDKVAETVAVYVLPQLKAQLFEPYSSETEHPESSVTFAVFPDSTASTVLET
mmetsp:Transcript_22311/g.31210  ORF Transcript_22311/g.31210 Transcript_22311/m.31210 type:complete len:85 (-) Transcript_22311:96-350(-)